MTTSPAHPRWEVLLRLPGTNSSATAARWFNRAFAARAISAHATETRTPFSRVRANSLGDLRRVIALVSTDPAIRDEISMSAYELTTHHGTEADHASQDTPDRPRPPAPERPR